MTKHTTFISYILPPTTSMHREDVFEVSSRDPELHALMAPMNAQAFYYYDVISHFDGTYTSSSGRCNISNRHFIDARVLTLDELSLLDKAQHIVKKMIEGGFERAVQCRHRKVVTIMQNDDALIDTLAA